MEKGEKHLPTRSVDLPAMDENKVNLPFRIRCDIFEVQITNACGDFLTSPDSGSAADIAFVWTNSSAGQMKMSLKKPT